MFAVFGTRTGVLARVAAAAAVVAVSVDALPAGAQAPPRVRVQADTSVITVGDRLRFTVSVEHAPGARVIWPDSLALPPFEVLAAEVEIPVARDGRAVSRARLTLTAFRLGELEIPSFDIVVETPEGGVAEVSTDPWAVEVVSVGLDEGGGIRSIKGPMTIAVGVISLLPWLLLALAVIGLAVWLRRRRRSEDERELGPVLLQRPPHEVAYEALDELARSGLLERGEVKEYHVRVSEIVRTYIEGRYDVYALEMTTGQVVDRLWRVGIEGELLERFRTFLERADLVKFAKARPTIDASRQMIDLARSLLDDTRSHVEKHGEDGQDPQAHEIGDDAEDGAVAEGAEDAAPAEVARGEG